MRADEIDAVDGLSILMGSDVTGPCLIEDTAHRAIYILNHFEYDSGTLGEEYSRDLAQNQIENAEITLPVNYPGDDPDAKPQNRWRSHTHLLYGNWISEMYLTTPYDMSKIGHDITDLRG